MRLLIRYLLTAAVVILISEVARRNPRIGGLITALPIVTLATLVWLHVDRQPAESIGRYASYTFWYVLPTLPVLLLFPALLARFGFWPAIGASSALAMACFAVLVPIVRMVGVDLQ